MKRLICAFTAVLIMINTLSLQALAGDNTFVDVAENDWFYDYVEWAYDNGIISGVSEDSFMPQENITVAQVITIAARIYANKNNSVVPDIESSDWYKKYTEYADKNKIATRLRYGYSYDRWARRSEVAEIFSTLIEDDEILNSNITTVPDMRDKARISEFVENTDYEAVLKLMQCGIVKGRDEYGSFCPDDTITRSEVAKIAYLVVNKDKREEFSFKEMTEDNPEYSAEKIYEDNVEAVFTILTYDKMGYAYSIGSGFFIESSGVAVTNYHVIEDVSGAQAYLIDGRVRNIEGVIGYSEKDDIAIVTLEGSGYKTVTLGDSDLIKNGQDITVIGSPFGISGVVTNGLISNTERKNGESFMIQISAPISAGNSGGPVILSDGTVIGIAAASYYDESVKHINFAVPVNYLYSIDNYDFKTFAFLYNQNNPIPPKVEKQGYGENEKIPDFEYVTGDKPIKQYTDETQTWISYGYEWKAESFNRYIAYLINNKWVRTQYEYDDYTERYVFEKDAEAVEISKIGGYTVVGFKRYTGD